MQRVQRELQALKKVKVKLGRKGYELASLLEDLEEMDDIDALKKLKDIQVSQYMEQKIEALERKGSKLFENRIDDVETPEENKITMELRKLRQSLRQMKVNNGSCRKSCQIQRGQKKN
jgi:hypothetical protein